MHAYTLPNIILALLLAFSSFLESPNSISVEARKLSTSDGVFKVELIHRNSPLSPYYKRELQGFESDNKSDATSYALKGNNGGQYFMKIALGTPKVEFLAVADTGSDLIWVQCAPCKTCFSQKSPLFDPTKSSTYHTIPCTSPNCTPPDLTTSCSPYNTSNNNNNNNNKSSKSCFYQSIYGDTRQSSGILATETISLPTPHPTSISLSSGIFGCGTDQQGPYNSPLEGFVGLGAGPSSLVSQLGPKINYKFSYCLAPLTSGVSSKLTFGADITGPKVVSTPFQIGLAGTQPTFYNLTLNGISVGDINNSVQLNSGLGIIIDSGTTLTMLPTNTYTSLKYSLKSAIGLNTIPSPLEDYDLCYNTSSTSGQQFSPPDVIFLFQGAEVVLKAFNTFREIEDGVSCLAMMATDGTPIFGNIAQVNFEIGYDLKAKQVSFAPTDCTKY
ncbi:aspartic proteinase CDR1-like [Chenopodium quinoa]|uniref:aspartic proteinase CDR1-like n=1 Tax=Chenopodium quinoa TaxID=63459 RepID=UPI000B7913BC|nr:aspartic proteinase CDR1-like [Chenopodium quinoa]